MKSDLDSFDVYTLDDWDGEGAQAVSAETLKLARALVSSTQDDIGLPDASPSVAGAIGLVWNVGSNYIYVAIRSQTIAMFYRRGPKGLTEDRSLEAYSADDLLEELTEKLLSVKVNTILDNPQTDLTHIVINIESPNIDMPKPLIPSDPDKWATTSNEMFEYKVA